MNTLTLADLADADLVQTFQGSIWAVTPRGVFDFWAPSCDDELAELETVLPYITAWRESGRNGTKLGRWHNVGSAAVWQELDVAEYGLPEPDCKFCGMVQS